MLFRSSPKLVTARLKAAFKNWGKTFDIEGEIEKLQLGSLWDHLPNALKSGQENIKAGGTLDATLKVKGNLPEKKDSGAKPITPLQQPWWARLLVPANTRTPVEMMAEIKLQIGRASCRERV